jgi:hypothetical protein
VIATAFVWAFANAIIRGWDVWREKIANSRELATA